MVDDLSPSPSSQVRLACQVTWDPRDPQGSAAFPAGRETLDPPDNRVSGPPEAPGTASDRTLTTTSNITHYSPLKSKWFTVTCTSQHRSIQNSETLSLSIYCIYMYWKYTYIYCMYIHTWKYTPIYTHTYKYIYIYIYVYIKQHNIHNKIIHEHNLHNNGKKKDIYTYMIYVYI